MAKASDNIYPLVRLAPGAAPASPAAGQQVLFLDSGDGNKLKRKDSAGVVSAIEGAAGGASRDYRWLVPAGMTSVDEFNDDTLDPAWVRIDPAGAAVANATWAEAGDTVAVTQLAGDSANVIRALARPLSGAGGSLAVGDGFVTCLRLFGAGNFVFGGLVFTDSTSASGGTQVMGLTWLNGSSQTSSIWSGSAWAASGSTAEVGVIGGSYVWVRLAQVATGSWRLDLSPDGVSWIKGTPLAKTITPTHVGLASSSWGGGAKGVVPYDFVRRVSGVS